jgi:predicted MFS family arabinose efflux permease
LSTNNSRWGLLAIICLYNIAVTLTYQSLPPVLSLIMEDMKISHAEAGLLMSAYTLPGIIIAVPLSLMYPRWGIKKLGLAALVLLVAGCLLMVFAADYPMLVAGRVLIGIGASALPIVGSQGVAQIFLKHRLGLAIGIYGIAMPLSTVIPFFAFGAAGIAWGWRSSLWITIAVCILAFIVMSIFFKMPEEYPGERSPRQTVKILAPRAILKIGWPMWTMAACWAFFLIGHMSLLTFLPDFIYKTGLDLSVAGSITGIIMLCSVILSPFIGHLLDLSRHKEIFIIAGAVAACLLVFSLALTDINIWFFVIALGILTAPFAVAISTITPTMIGRELMALAYSINFMGGSLGMFVGPYLSGLIRDNTGSYTLSFVFMALFFLLAALLASVLLLRRIQRNRPALSASK